ncbi:MAG: TonB-dependent receptor [Bacteroidales bacterium]
MKKIIFIWLCGLLCLSASANIGVITGTVTDKNSGEPLSYLNVILKDLSSPGGNHSHDAGTMTDDSGSFNFESLCDGRYKIRIQGVGFVGRDENVEIKNGRPVKLAIELEEQVFTTAEVVVSANRNETSRKLAPVVVNVLSGKMLETVNSCDLAQGLNYQSGLRVENNCQNCGFPQVRINGLDGPYSQVLINSRPVLSALSGVYGLEQIPTNMIDRIEVVRGGGSALFGSNAVGGTINVITKDPVNNSFQINSSLSNLAGKGFQTNISANASLVGADNKYGIAVYQAFRDRHGVDLDGDGYTEIGKLNARNFGLRGYIRPSSMSRLSIEYQTTQEFRRGGNLLSLPPHEADICEQTDHNINGGGLTYDLYFDEYKHKLSVYTSLQHIDRKSYYGAGKDPNAYGKTNDMTYVAGAMGVNKLDRFLVSPATLTYGVEYQSNSLHDRQLFNEEGEDLHDMKQDVRIGGGFLQSEWAGDYLSLLTGIRMDKHNLIESLIVSPRINLLYKPNDAIQGRLTFSSGFRAPQAYDEDLHVAAVGGEKQKIVLADNLKEERSYSYSGSIDLYKNSGNWQMNLLTELFYTQLNDVFVLEEILSEETGVQLLERRNGKGAKVYGINLDGKLAYGNLAQLQVGFTMQKSLYRSPQAWSEDENVAPTKQMLRTPDDYGYLTLTVNPWKKLQLVANGTYTGKMWVGHFGNDQNNKKDELKHTPRFFDLNFKASYDFKIVKQVNLQVNAGIQNIFDSRQKDYDQGALRDSKYFYGPTQPRTVFIGVKLFN